ncbi:hypothetical protein D0Z07_2992 [Hyphodiscus hymeniophilus]|uniref:Eukaryotic mitochondrial regulator protein-domain-containing protein n=1 Tax=Hyphodiscus hymeniophilus TaxID=353542 RepID=A0A9P7AYI5_9HELO|nr:hypothetical protein D0Z07_2992 [Hyphodiscus hymeniophilus]
MTPPLRCHSVICSLSYTGQFFRTAQSRSFSITSQRDQRVTRARRALFRWLQTNGVNFLQPLEGSTNYLSAYNAQGQLRRVVEREEEAKKAKTGEKGQKSVERDPNARDKIPHERPADLRVFPQNPTFLSQPVLSEEFREVIWKRIMEEGESVRDVSAALKVEMGRVGAVVRLKEIEKEWQRILMFNIKGKPLARPYAQAVMSMLPKTAYDADPRKLKTHESINDLPVHAATGPQIFYPTSESRHFTRVDAAKVFDDTLLPADDRVPHPELSLMHKDFRAGKSRQEINEKQRERDEKAAKDKARIAARRAKKLAAVKKVQSPRWEFRFTDVNVDDIGKDGRGAKGVGWRYGVPLMDRSRAQVKIPTRVE